MSVWDQPMPEVIQDQRSWRHEGERLELLDAWLAVAEAEVCSFQRHLYESDQHRAGDSLFRRRTLFFKRRPDRSIRSAFAVPEIRAELDRLADERDAAWRERGQAQSHLDLLENLKKNDW